jgi:hypothetical protein
VTDSIECPLQLYWWNSAVLLWQQDICSCQTHCDYEYVLCCEKKEDIEDQVISLEKESTCGSAN